MITIVIIEKVFALLKQVVLTTDPSLFPLFIFALVIASITGFLFLEF